MKRVDGAIVAIDKMLRVATGIASSSRPNPARGSEDHALDETERRHSAGLMRINHVGEVCAQALYEAQGRFAANEELRSLFAQAGREEEDHLAWTMERLKELGARPSLLNPFWYAGSFVLRMVAARAGDKRSLGFVMETERQVESHLAGHLQTLPAKDEKSRAIVDQMRADEASHSQAARAMGASDMPMPVRKMMQAMAKVMTTTAYYV